MNSIKTICLVLSGLGLLLFTPATARGEQLPIKIYTTSDGLASNRISRIVRDSRGYLWFCTENGLSRFDGYSFTSYTTEQGLPDNDIHDLLETHDGAYWVATGKGLCRYNPKGLPLSTKQSSLTSEPMFVVYRPDGEPGAAAIKTLYQDRRGTVWVGSWRGLYHLEQIGAEVRFHYVEMGMPPSEPQKHVVRNMLEDRQGALWMTTDCGLYRRWPDGRVDRFTANHGLASDNMMGLAEDRQGRLWVGNRSGGLCLLVADPVADRAVVERRYTTADGLGCVYITSILESSDGKLWAGADCGLSEMLPQTDRRGQSITIRLSDRELTDLRVWSLAEDRQGNLWVGTANGAVKVARGGFTTYSIADGLGSRDICSIAETSRGELYVYSRSHRNHFINRFDGYGFSAIGLNLPAGLNLADCGSCLQDREDRWWLAVDSHLLHFPKTLQIGRLEGLRPEMGSKQSQGAFILYKDNQGDIWMSTTSRERILRWERHTRTLHSYPDVDGLPAGLAPNVYAEDKAGNLWIAVGYLSLARYSKNSFKVFTAAADKIPAITSLFGDSRGRLWIASYGNGVGRIDDPSADRLTVVTYTEAEGLSSNKVSSIVEDRWGRMFIGTDQGLDRLDLTTGRIKHFTTADGLANNQVKTSFRDRNGALWFGTTTGVSRHVPELDGPESSDVFINRIQISGDLYPVSELGESVVRGLELEPGQNNIHIGFAGLSFGAGGALRYQYKLEGGDTDWTELANQREVNYASLSPGSYRFLVQAVNAEGIASNEPATFEFTILPPLWQRWWFLTAAAVVAALAVYSIYRYRVARLIEVERIRTRIAADLHDDIGANLTKIGILSEVAHQQMNGGERRVAEPISTIARISRESVTSMSDIVWAINPRMDSLRDLVSHMREFAGEMFANCDIEFDFRAPSSDVNLRLGADVRRTVYLIFKEAVNNIVRHAESSKADIELRIEGAHLVLTVADDGRGFERSQEGAGNGLLSIERRAAQAGGRVEIVSSQNAGTRIELRLPVKHGSGVRGKG